MARSIASRLGLNFSRASKRSMVSAAVGTTVQMAEIVGSTAAFSYLRHRLDDPMTGRNDFQILGIDPELLVGLGVHAASVFGILGKWADHADNFADGALSAFIYPIAAAAGTQARDRAAARVTTSGRRQMTGQTIRPSALPPRSNVTPLNVAAWMRSQRAA